MRKTSTVQRLRAAGFDRSTVEPFAAVWHVQCSQCAAAVINGVACHETGCPNVPSYDDDDEGEY